MIDFLTYDLKVAAILAVFYMFYRLMLAHETFHRVNRVVLLATAVASFVLPRLYCRCASSPCIKPLW